MDDYENPLPGKTYISPSLKPFAFEGKEGDRVRIASKVVEADESYAFAEIKGERVIRLTKSGTTAIMHLTNKTSNHTFEGAASGATEAAGAPGSEAHERLARALFEELENLDPSLEETTWEMLSDSHRQVYRSCLNHILTKGSDLLVCCDFAHNNDISRAASCRE